VERFSQHRSCDRCGRAFEELTPHHFSFNAPLGWCPACYGLGVQTGAGALTLIPDERKSLRQGAIAIWPDFATNRLFAAMIEAMARETGIDLEAPVEKLDPRHRRLILHGTGTTWFRVGGSADAKSNAKPKRGAKAGKAKLGGATADRATAGEAAAAE